jgi:hypothetical protein
MSDLIGKTCPYCQFPVKGHEELVVCSECGIPHHTDCWNENHGCTTFGCTGHPADSSSALNSLNRPSGYIEIDAREQKRYCSRCGTANNESNEFCTHCGAGLQSTGYTPPGRNDRNDYRPGDVPNHLTKAILVTIFCCLPFGIPAIVYAAKVNTRLEMGDYEGAVEASNSAKTWYVTSFWVGLAVNLIIVIVRIMIQD